ncbi:MAG TPA: GNAT family protein [Herpetosiphonaceae bacterium]
MIFKHDLGGGVDLRILELRHAPALLTLIEENRTYFGEWLGWADTIATVEEAQSFIKRGMTCLAEDGLPWCGIWLHDRMVGGVLCFPVERRIRATSIGYWLSQQATGQGIMTRAARAMLGFAFDDLSLNRVALEAEVGNVRSRAVAERLGFTFEGIRRHGWVNRGQFVDIAVYSLLASDWQGQKAAQ